MLTSVRHGWRSNTYIFMQTWSVVNQGARGGTGGQRSIISLTFTEQPSVLLNQPHTTSPLGGQNCLHLVTRSFPATLPRNSCFPPHHTGLFHVTFGLFLRRAVPPLTANSLMAALWTLSLNENSHKANRTEGVGLVETDLGNVCCCHF